MTGINLVTIIIAAVEAGGIVGYVLAVVDEVRRKAADSQSVPE